MWTPVYYVRLVSLPSSISGVTVPNDDGSFDIYLNASLCESRQKACLGHEIRHIIEDHFYQETKSVAQLEQEADLPDSFRNYMFATQEQTHKNVG